MATILWVTQHSPTKSQSKIQLKHTANLLLYQLTQCKITFTIAFRIVNSSTYSFYKFFGDLNQKSFYVPFFKKLIQNAKWRLSNVSSRTGNKIVTIAQIARPNSQPCKSLFGVCTKNARFCFQQTSPKMFS